MEANPVNIIDYFNGEKQSIIPLFQRQYTWSKKHWDVLWDDILTQYDAGTSSVHFMGAVVSVSARSVPAGVSKHLIIDGQQRLTTISILLRALKERVGPRNAGRIEDYLLNRHHDGADQLKLLPTQGDREEYRALVLDKVPPIDGGQVAKAFAFFQKQLRGKDGDGNPIDAERVLETLRCCLQVVMINLADSDDPYLIFESLNHKGEPLTQSDLVRNYVLMRFPHSLDRGGEQERVYAEYWKPLQATLSENLTDFLGHYSMKDGESVKRGSVYAAIKGQLTNQNDAELRATLQSMVRHGAYYRAFVDPETEIRSDVRHYLSAFRELDFGTSYPLLLRLFDATERGKASQPELVRSLRMIESFSVRRSVCHMPTHGLNKLFVSWAKRFDENQPAVWLAETMSSATGGHRWPRDPEFVESLTNDQQYGRKHLRYLLKAFERSYGHKEAVDLAPATIEHILPQQLSDGWIEAIGHDHVDVQAKWVDTLGNLTLTAYNPELGNRPFDEKKAMLKDSHIDLNRWICEQSRWDGETIAARASVLCGIAKSLWPGPEAFNA